MVEIMKIVNGQAVYQLELTDPQLLVLREGLGKVMWERANPVMDVIKSQLSQQQKPAEVPKTDDQFMAEHHGRYTGTPNA
jgi:hypothetical protein